MRPYVRPYAPYAFFTFLTSPNSIHLFFTLVRKSWEIAKSDAIIASLESHSRVPLIFLGRRDTFRLASPRLAPTLREHIP